MSAFGPKIYYFKIPQKEIYVYRKYKQVINNIEEAKQMLDDPDMKEMAEEEISSLEPQKEDTLVFLGDYFIAFILSFILFN